jgi:hypothetical protein
LEISTSPVSSEISDADNFATDSVSIAMQHIFTTSEIFRLDLADGLKQLLYQKHCDLNFLQSDAATVAHELGIEKYVAKIIVHAAKKATTK